MMLWAPVLLVVLVAVVVVVAAAAAVRGRTRVGVAGRWGSRSGIRSGMAGSLDHRGLDHGDKKNEDNVRNN